MSRQFEDPSVKLAVESMAPPDVVRMQLPSAEEEEQVFLLILMSQVL